MPFNLTPAQQALQQKARALARGEIARRAAEIDRSEQYPWENVALLREAGFFGMTIPAAYGGQGASYFDAVLVIEEMAQCCGVTARIVVEANMGALGAIMAYGSEPQKRLAAELVLAGDKPAICITEPAAGSAASEMTTRADRRGNGFVINGRKHWITGGGVSRLHLVFARVFDEAGREEGIGGFIALRDETPGLRIGKREPAMGLRGIPEAEILFEDMAVPADALILPPRGLRKGFADLMTAYNGQRIGAATVALGLAEGAYALALAYAQEREQFGRPIAEFQGLQWMLADMATQLAAAQALIYKAAAPAGSAFPDACEAAQAKIFASEMAIKVTNDALQLFGAAGYSRNLPLERMVRDARMFTIGGGTAQILRTVVASRLLGRKLPQTRDGYVAASDNNE
ncbi:MAG TPA: 3-sulfinopropanoyl-CoA desulfinase [Stellaceae bacterium]|nr:3-sulfinopropanoyl-CoA desulfinase [Stellaceae bacterium]